jgi:alpha-tubulin suppressor-like RCC1 family protein
MAGRPTSTSFQRISLGATRVKAIAVVLITAVTFALVLVVTPTNISRPVVHADANEGASNDQKAISAGDGTTCVLTTSGNVRCWGNNESRQVNDTPTSSFPNPTASHSSTNGQEIISVAQDFTCAISSPGDLKCWGNQNGGRLGNGTTEDVNTGQAQTVTGTYSAVGVGANHACAVTTGGAVKCWG